MAPSRKKYIFLIPTTIAIFVTELFFHYHSFSSHGSFDHRSRLFTAHSLLFRTYEI